MFMSFMLFMLFMLFMMFVKHHDVKYHDNKFDPGSVFYGHSFMDMYTRCRLSVQKEAHILYKIDPTEEDHLQKRI